MDHLLLDIKSNPVSAVRHDGAVLVPQSEPQMPCVAILLVKESVLWDPPLDVHPRRYWDFAQLFLQLRLPTPDPASDNSRPLSQV